MVTTKSVSTHGYDILKFFMALMIVAIHTQAYLNAEFKMVFWPFIRSAVPIFFILSSIFYFKKQRNSGYSLDILSHFLKRLGLLYLFWAIINIPFIASKWTSEYNEPSIYLNIVKFVRNLFFYQIYSGAWFFMALAVAILVITLLKRIKLHSVLIGMICLVFYSFVWWHDSFNNVYEALCPALFPRPNLSCCVAFLWCYLGYLLSSPKIQEKITMGGVKVISHILLLAVYAWFVYLDGSNQDYAWMNLIIAPLLVIAVGTWRLPDSELYKQMRSLSVLIFMNHFIIIKILKQIVIIDDKVFYYLTIVTLTLLVSSIILLLEKKYKINIFKYSH